jgi:hypothetical protein
MNKGEAMRPLLRAHRERPAPSSMSPRLPPTRKSSRMPRRTPHVYCAAHARAVAAA